MRAWVLMVASASAASAQPTAAPPDRVAQYEQLYQETRNPALLWLIAEAHARGGRQDQALATLQKVTEQRLGFAVTAESPLSKLAGNPRFDALAARLRQDARVDGKARQVSTIALAGLIPEGLTADPGTRTFFLGDSAGKRIISFRQGAKPKIFATTDLPPLGMMVDKRRQLLWVAATTSFNAADTARSAVLAFDLRNGRLERSYSAPELKSVNDVALAPGGQVYVTDSLGGSVFRVDPESGRVERVTAAAAMGYPNGVAVSPNGESIYVAQGLALRRLDPGTGALTPVKQPPSLALHSIDGLYWHKGALIAVQNGGHDGRVLRLQLAPDGSAITGFQVLEAANPQFDIPTTGVVVGDRFYFIANSQLTRLQQDGTISPDPPLKPIGILSVQL